MGSNGSDGDPLGDASDRGSEPTEQASTTSAQARDGTGSFENEAGPPDDDSPAPNRGERRDSDGSDGCSCKVGRSARTYDLDDLDGRLGRRHADGASLRELERFVNEAILGRALLAADADVLGDVGSVYETLAGDEASAGEQTELRSRLESAGVDVAAVESDFVSYQTVRTHLGECLGVDTDREAPLAVDDGRGTIEWSRARSEGIVERTLERLARSDEVTAGDLDVTYSVRVRCTDCGYSAPVEAFLETGGCDCPPDDDRAPDVDRAPEDERSPDDD